MNSIDSIILAGGYARRMYPTTLEIPKQLLPVAGRSMLNYILDSLEKLYSHKTGTCYLSVNNKFETDFRNFLKENETEIPLELVVQKTSCIGAIGKTFKEYVSPKNDTLVIGGDNIFSLDLSKFLKYHEEHLPEKSTIALYDIGDTEKAKLYGIPELNENNEITDLEEKPEHPKSSLVSTAIYCFKETSLERIDEYEKKGNDMDKLGNYVKWLIKNTDGIKGYIFTKYWFDVGSHKVYEDANKRFRKISKESKEKYSI